MSELIREVKQGHVHLLGLLWWTGANRCWHRIQGCRRSKVRRATCHDDVMHEIYSSFVWFGIHQLQQGGHSEANCAACVAPLCPHGPELDTEKHIWSRSLTHTSTHGVHVIPSLQDQTNDGMEVIRLQQFYKETHGLKQSSSPFHASYCICQGKETATCSSWGQSTNEILDFIHERVKFLL